MVFGFTGLTARELMDSPGSFRSVSGVQLGLAAVALVVFHTPPLTAPAYTRSALWGSVAMASTAPAAVDRPSSRPPVIGPGPCSTQVADGTSRASSRSTRRRDEPR